MCATGELLGVTSCDECGARFKIRESKKHLIGKSARCSKCHSIFRIELENPTTAEQVGFPDECSADENDAPRKRRRTKKQIREENIQQIHDGFCDLHARLTEISNEPKSSEEEVRRWCIDSFRNCLGYSDDEIVTELRVLGNRVDIALKKDDKVFLVVEVKNIRHRLKNAKEQAANYATSLGASWAAVTNGQIWRLYRVIPVKGNAPKLIEVFDIALLDEDGVSEADSECLYLLTARAIFGGETDSMFHSVAASSVKRILTAMGSERVLKSLTKELEQQYKNDFDVNPKLDLDLVHDAVCDLFDATEL